MVDDGLCKKTHTHRVFRVDHICEALTVTIGFVKRLSGAEWARLSHYPDRLFRAMLSWHVDECLPYQTMIVAQAGRKY